MKIYISTADGTPIYRQIAAQIKHMANLGRLTPGQELPTIRALAQELLINPNTVARAYRELESAGILESHRGAGTHLTAHAALLAQQERLKLLTEQIDTTLEMAAQLEVSFPELIDLMAERHPINPTRESQEVHHDNESRNTAD